MHVVCYINVTLIVLFFSSFWPSCFFYMSTMIPIIWVAEIEFLNERIQATNEANDTSSAPKSPIPGVGSFHNKLEH